jgi:murein DD-endopeptidase MepM/ murein hydrolase activator NlpD
MSTLHRLVVASVTFRWSSWSLVDFAAPLVGARDWSPFLEPEFCTAAIRTESERHGAHGYVGGYLEDRATLWRGSYLAPNRAVHLGVDISGEVGFPVLVPEAGWVHEAWHDPDQNGGWGGRLILSRPGGGFLILAHLDLLPGLAAGRPLAAGQWIGTLAPSARNGGWFPHLHLQLAASGEDLAELDGYGPDRPDNSTRFPDPLATLGFASGR